MTRFALLAPIVLALTGLTACAERAATAPPEPVPSLASTAGEPSIDLNLSSPSPAPERVEHTEAAPEVVESADRLGAPSPELYEASGLRLRRLVLARDIQSREPVETGVLFPAEERPIYAFVDVANDTTEDRHVRVVFERPDGQNVGLVELTVPASAPRWRTWALSRMVTEPGEWIANVETEDGELLGRQPFTMAPVS